MKIDSSRQKGPVQKTSGPSGTGAARKTDKAGSSQSAAESKGPVSFSGTDKIAASMNLSASQRASKVEGIKAALDEGSYRDDAQATAQKIVQNLTDYSLA